MCSHIDSLDHGIRPIMSSHIESFSYWPNEGDTGLGTTVVVRTFTNVAQTQGGSCLCDHIYNT